MFKIRDISELNRRIVIQSPTITRDAHGGEIKTWATVRTCWAKMESVSTMEINERKEAERLSNIMAVVWYIRYWTTTEITNKMRISYGGNYYDIETVLDVDDFKFLMIKTKKVE